MCVGLPAADGAAGQDGQAAAAPLASLQVVQVVVVLQVWIAAHQAVWSSHTVASCLSHSGSHSGK
eukprot:350357-Chlamydomonas_euryale.AAC.1